MRKSMYAYSNQTDILFMKNQKGGELLWKSGYKFVLHKQNFNKTTLWRCRRSRYNCTASLTLDIKKKRIIRSNPKHAGCFPDYTGYAKAVVRAELIRYVLNNTTLPVKKAYDDFIESYKLINPTAEFDMILPDYNKVKTTLFRGRKFISKGITQETAKENADDKNVKCEGFRYVSIKDENVCSDENVIVMIESGVHILSNKLGLLALRVVWELFDVYVKNTLSNFRPFAESPFSDQADVLFTKSRNGGDLLWRSGYKFFLQRRNVNDITIWHCMGKRRKNCKAYLTLDINKRVLRNYPIHTGCCPDPTGYEKAVVRAELVRSVVNNTGLTVKKAYENFIESYKLINPTAEFDILPDYNSIKTTLFRERKSMSGGIDHETANENAEDKSIMSGSIGFVDNEDILFTKNQRGGDLLWRAGYRYCLKRNNEHTTIWRCCNKNRGCHGTLTYHKERKRVIKINSMHKCHPDPIAYEKEVVRADMVRFVRMNTMNTTMTLRKAYDNFVATYKLLNPTADFDAIVPKYDTMLKALKKQTKQENLKMMNENKAPDNDKEQKHLLTDNKNNKSIKTEKNENIAFGDVKEEKPFEMGNLWCKKNIGNPMEEPAHKTEQLSPGSLAATYHEDIFFTKSQRGRDILWRAGYRYCLKRDSELKSVWSCYNKNVCHASVTYHKFKKRVIKINSIHKCKPHPDPVAYEKEIVRAEMMRYIRMNTMNTTLTFRKAYDNFVATYKLLNPTADFDVILPKYKPFINTIKKKIIQEDSQTINKNKSPVSDKDRKHLLVVKDNDNKSIKLETNENCIAFVGVKEEKPSSDGVFLEEDEIIFTKSKAGGDIMWRAGYKYSLKRRTKEMTVWRCCNRNICNGKLAYDNTRKKATKIMAIHKCQPDPVACDREMILAEMRSAVRNNTTLTVKEAYDDFVKTYKLLNPQCDFELILPKFHHVKHHLYKERNSKQKAKPADINDKRAVLNHKDNNDNDYDMNIHLTVKAEKV
ncbi:FLYWCH zinc finger domain-containing protein [Phthorimaea operculella]|nr:FLYWCH zinc finger domain-containing protein [Phthorimaea operculella]